MQSNWRWWWGASLVAHATLMSVAISTAPFPSRAVAGPGRVDVEFAPAPPARPTAALAATDPAPTAVPRAPAPARPARLGGSRSAQNVSSDNPGEAGDGRSA